MAQPIEKDYVIRASPAAVWQALVDPKIIDRWGGGPAEMDDRSGSDFKLWGGDIWGKNLEVETGKRLVQEWYSGDWASPSIATSVLSPEANGTRLTLCHIDVPDDEQADIDEGWDLYYLGAIRGLLEGKT